VGVPDGVGEGGGIVLEGVAPTDIVPVVVFVGVMVCVNVAEGESVIRAVTLGVIVLDIVLLGV
jgi:hypothetical protein